MDLSSFRNKIVTIQPKNLNIFETGSPGIVGSSAAGRGGSTEADIILSLNRLVYDLLDGLKSGKKINEISRAKEQVIAELKNCRVMNLIYDNQFDELMVDLSKIGEDS